MEFGLYMATAVRESITGIWEQSPQRGPGAESPGQEVRRAKARPKADIFFVLGRPTEGQHLPPFPVFCKL